MCAESTTPLRHHVKSRESERHECFESAGIYGGCVVGRLVGRCRLWQCFQELADVWAFRISGTGTRKSIALTFDDGPSESTPDLLDYLDKEGIAATFFQCGMNVKRLPHIAGQVAAAGHEIGNHSYSHPNCRSNRAILSSVNSAQAQRVIESETGVTPMLMRAPYGFRWMGMREVQERLLLLGVMWTVIGFDWRWPAERVSEYVLRHRSPGGIVCLHDGRGVEVRPQIANTLEACARSCHACGTKATASKLSAPY